MHLWLQEHFKNNKQFGSRDRRFYRDACYSYFKNGIVTTQISTSQAICLGLISQNLYLEECEQYLKANPVGEIKTVPPFSPYENLTNLSLEELNAWFKKPAPVFLVPNPEKKTILIEGLKSDSIEFELTEDAFKIGLGKNLDRFISAGIARVMDIGSQLSMQNLPIKPHDYIWDCCAGAGGKTLQLSQLYPTANLYASDSRSTILQNLANRYKLTRMKKPAIGVNNLSVPVKSLRFENDLTIKDAFFNVVVADVPCTGSGTWRRNPEELHFFKLEKLSTIKDLQFNIAANALSFLKPGGFFIYLTCSVFKAENENVVEKLIQEFDLKFIQNNYCGGAKKEGDYIFRSVLQKTES